MVPIVDGGRVSGIVRLSEQSGNQIRTGYIHFLRGPITIEHGLINTESDDQETK